METRWDGKLMVVPFGRDGYGNISEWVENCRDCHIPMEKVAVAEQELVAAPIPDTVMFDNKPAWWDEWKKNPQVGQMNLWLCGKCGRLWGLVMSALWAVCVLMKKPPLPKQEEPQLDDSRLKGYSRRVTHPTMPLERTYCSICGNPKGWVTQENSEYIRVNQIVVVCDGCVEQFGAPPLVEAKIPEVKLD